MLSLILSPNFLDKLFAAAVAPMVHASFPIWARSLGEYTLFFNPFRDLGQTDFSTSEFAAVIAEEGITLAKDPLGLGSDPSFRLK